jgi:hypothetical protein
MRDGLKGNYAPHVRESVGRARGGRRCHGDWFPVVFAVPVRQTLDGGYGLRPEDKAKVAEMRKSAGLLYGISFLASLITAFILGKIIYNFTIDLLFMG